MSIRTVGSNQQGRARINKCFSATFPTSTPVKSPASTKIPTRRYFGIKSNITANASQIQPTSPRNVIFGIRKSKKPHRSECCIQYKIEKSSRISQAIVSKHPPERSKTVLHEIRPHATAGYIPQAKSRRYLWAERHTPCPHQAHRYRVTS